MRNKLNKGLLACYSIFVIVPLLLIVFYLTMFAKDRYQSASTLLVKQVAEAQTTTSGGLGALLGNSSTSREDAQILKEFINSRDMVERLDQRLNLKKIFYAQKDPIFALKEDASVEELVAYFKKAVKVSLDEQTMMLHVTSQGFSPELSLKLSQEILKLSNEFINQISNSIAAEQQVFAEKQYNEAKDKLDVARNAVLEYQNKNEIFDPELQANAVATLISGLQSNLAQLKTEERTLLGYLTEEAPQVVAIKNQIESVEEQIETERGRLTSPNNAKLNQNVADFEALKAQVGFATDLYKLSLASLEKARLEASRNLKKLVVISAPRLAEDALYPRKMYISITSFILLNIVFGIGLLIHSIIREHRD